MNDEQKQKLIESMIERGSKKSKVKKMYYVYLPEVDMFLGKDVRTRTYWLNPEPIQMFSMGSLTPVLFRKYQEPYEYMGQMCGDWESGHYLSHFEWVLIEV